MTQASQFAFQAAATQTVEFGDNATAYVFFPKGDRKDMIMRAENVFYESSDTGLYGGERHDTDTITKSPADCQYQAQAMLAKMHADTQPKAIVFVHEPQRFNFNSAAVAAKIHEQTIPAKQAQGPAQSVWQRLMNRYMP
jgi:hypothetical protein